MRFLLFILMMLCVLLSLPASAQERVADRQFYMVSTAVVLSSLWDAETTMRGLERCSTCREANPIARPIVEAGRPATYAFMLATDAAVIAIAYKMKQRGRKYWWALPVAVTVVHVAAGGLNARYAF